MVGVTGLAGCGGGSDGGTPTDTVDFETMARNPPSESRDVEAFTSAACTPAKDDRFDFIEGSDPDDVNVAVNAGIGDHILFTLMSPIITQWTGRGSPDPEFTIPLLYDEFELREEGTVWYAHMVEDHAGWHDGSDLHVNDFVYGAQFENRYEKLTGSQAESEHSPIVEEFEVVDDYTFRAPLRERRHPGTFFVGVPYSAPVHPAHETEWWWERMMDATSADTAEQIYREYSGQETSLAENPDRHVGNAVFEIESVTDSYVELVKWDEHKYADSQNVDTIRTHFFDDSSAVRQAWADGVPDFGYPPGDADLPDHYTEARYPAIEGGGLDLSQWHTDFSRRGFRQAIFYASNFARVAYDSGAFPDQHWIGMPRLVARQWIDDWEDFTANTIDYGTRAKPEKAVSLLEETGYSKQGGTWKDPDGNTVSFTIGIPNSWEGRWGEHVLRDQWRDFGFEVEYTVFEEDNWSGWGNGMDEYVNPRHGHWDVTMGNRGPDNGYYPYIGVFSDTNYYQGWQITPSGQEFDRRGWNYADRDVEFEIPTDVGVETIEDAGSDVETFDVREAQTTIIDPRNDEETVKKHVRKAAWAMNFDLPCNYVNADRNSFAGNTRDFEFPDLDGDGRPDNYYSNRLDRGLIHSKCQ